MKGISRCEMNRLMAIPEVQQIVAAKFVELRLIFKNQLKEKEQQEQHKEQPDTSNIIKFPHPHKKIKAKTSTANSVDEIKKTGSNRAAMIKIVDASSYRYSPEEEQVKVFMDYFNSHRFLRTAILDEFFLRILPYSNIMVK
jgi:hypothetical protein